MVLAAPRSPFHTRNHDKNGSVPKQKSTLDNGPVHISKAARRQVRPNTILSDLASRQCEMGHRGRRLRTILLRENLLRPRREMENRIKECQLDLYADRTSTATMRANQMRLWFASMAYVLLCALRRIGLYDTEYAKATCGLRHHSSQAAQNRSSRAHQRPPHQSRDGIRMSCSHNLGARCRPSCRCRKSSRLTRLIRVAATRNKRGIIPRSTETNSSLPPQPGKIPQPLASPDATVECARQNADKAPRKIARSCSDTVR
jgi:Transposase DDE domain group 1